MIGYVCKYTPIHIIEAFGESVSRIEPNVRGFEKAETLMHPNICTYAKAVLEECINSGVRNVVLVNCCDSIKRLYDVLVQRCDFDFVYIIDVPRKKSRAAELIMKKEILKFIHAMEDFKGKKFDVDKFVDIVNSDCTESNARGSDISVALMGSRARAETVEQIKNAGADIFFNFTCNGNYEVPSKIINNRDAINEYSSALINKFPCIRMVDIEKRRKVLRENIRNIQGIIYHTTKFCDMYSFEYAYLKDTLSIPVLKIETDYTEEGSGQMRTRIEAFVETLKTRKDGGEKSSVEPCGKKVVLAAGIDSGSTSTNVVIINQRREILSYSVVRTGAKSKQGVEAAFKQAVDKLNIDISDIDKIVSTGYGRVSIPFADEDVTEITCHGKAAFFIDNSIRTIVDIGGQDSKAIRLDEKGNVIDFAMNDKCAAGTGRFLEMMSRTLEVPLEKMGKLSLEWKEDIDITSMCSVFAESEVVSLIANNKDIPDIIHGLSKSVASKTASLVNRIGKMGNYMMTGGVAKNAGVVKCLEKKLGASIIIPEEPQIAGALGAALIALENI